LSGRLQAGAGFLALGALAIAVLCAGMVILVAWPLIGGMSAAGDVPRLGAAASPEPAATAAGHPRPEAAAADPGI
jgi:hypothetical protein